MHTALRVVLVLALATSVVACGDDESTDPPDEADVPVAEANPPEPNPAPLKPQGNNPIYAWW